MIILFDTDCVLCSGGARFVLRHERASSAQFVSAWSDTGRALAARHGVSVADLDLTFLVIEDDRALIKSDAALAVVKCLRAPWRWARVFRFTPRLVRDWVYDTVARNRYRWFGQKDQCFVVPPQHSARFVPGPPRSDVLAHGPAYGPEKPRTAP